MAPRPDEIEAPPEGPLENKTMESKPATSKLTYILGATTVALAGATIALGVLYGDAKNAQTAAAMPPTQAAAPSTKATAPRRPPAGTNPCDGAKPIEGFKNHECMVNGVVQALEQAGANVTLGYKGELDAGGRVPITSPYFEAGLCPVNVHWHLGAEHLSVGEYDENGKGPMDNMSEEREGFECHYYDEADPKFTTQYEWKYCKDMVVGQTYEVHWPHSAAGACGTVNQYQTPFYDGVFCMPNIISLDPLNTYMKIGVQAQVFTIVNDEAYYYPDLFRGMIVDSEREMGTQITKYTGSTSGTTRDNDTCSKYTPVTWQVDRKCHMISASTFDKMCADMMAQRDDMSDDLHAHGSRELVADYLAANNHQNLRRK